jgi:hypothetical protein
MPRGRGKYTQAAIVVKFEFNDDPDRRVPVRPAQAILAFPPGLVGPRPAQ